MMPPTRKQKEERQRKVLSVGKWAKEHEAGGFVRTAVKLPEGVKSFRPKEAGRIYRLNVIPYVAGAGNPDFDEGELAVFRTWFGHKQVGVNEDMFVCTAKTFNKPCPICERKAALIAQGRSWDDDEVRSLKPTERQLFNVIDLDNPDDGIQVWDVSDWLFGKHLRAKINHREKYGTYADLDEGYVLSIQGQQGKGESWITFSSIEFEERGEDEKVTEEDVEKATCLDTCLIDTPYDKLKRVFAEGVDAPIDDDDRPSRSEKKDAPVRSERPVRDSENGHSRKKDAPPPEPKDDDDEDGEDPELGNKVRHKEKGLCEVVKVRADGLYRLDVLEDGDDFGEILDKVKRSEFIFPVEDEDDSEQDEDEDEDEDSEEEERPRRSSRSRQ